MISAFPAGPLRSWPGTQAERSRAYTGMPVAPVAEQDAVERVDDSDIEMVIGTDSVENQWVEMSDKIRVVSVAPLFAEPS